MERSQQPDIRMALFATLAEAQAAQEALQAAGAPYPALQLEAHTPAELERLPSAERDRLPAQALPARFWSLAIRLEPPWRDQALAALRDQHPLAVGHWPSPDNRRDDAERGAIAWGHYVFETSAATDAVGEGAGTTGTTGIINSGVFAAGARAEGDPPADALDTASQRQSDAHSEPTTDTQQPKVATHRSRPQTELTDDPADRSG